MPIWTTYLGFLNKHKDTAEKLGSCFVYYVMRNRGNNEVAPSEPLLLQIKAGDIDWETYEKEYLVSLDRNIKPFAEEWMKKRAEEAKIGNILLVCFEKSSRRCHRRLLAEEISRRYGAEYKGEVTEEQVSS